MHRGNFPGVTISMKLTNIDSSYVLKFKALSDTTRLKMLPHLSEPHTVKQFADMLNVDHHALYHHMRVLESAKIARLVKTRKMGNIVEKYFQLTDNWVTVPDKAMKDGSLPINPLVRQAVLSILEDLNETVQAGNESGQVHRVWYKVKKENLEKTHKQIADLVTKFINDIDSLEDDKGDLSYTINLVHFKMPTGKPG